MIGTTAWSTEDDRAIVTDLASDITTSVPAVSRPAALIGSWVAVLTDDDHGTPALYILIPR